MSEPRIDSGIDQMLAGWMGDVAPDRAPSRLLEGTFARTMTTRQVRRYPWRRVGIGAMSRAGAGSGLRTGVLVLVALVVAAFAVGLLGGGLRLVTPANPSPSPTSTSPTPITVIPEAVIPVQRPNWIVTAGSEIWTLGNGKLDRIDPISNAVTASVALGGPADLYNDLAANEAGLWVSDWDRALVYRVDPTTFAVVARIPAGLAPKGILVSSTGVWVADTHDGKVLRIDPATNAVVATIAVGPSGNNGPNWLYTGFGSIWVNIPNNGTVVRIDPLSNAIQATIRIPGTVLPCGGFDFEITAVWVTECDGSNNVAEIDPATNTVIGTGSRAGSGAIPTLVNGGLWVDLDTGDATSGMLVRIDRATNSIDRILVPGSSFGGGGGITVVAGTVWVADPYNNAVLRLPLAPFGP